MHFKNAIVFVSCISFLFNILFSKHTHAMQSYKKHVSLLKLNKNLKSNNKNSISLIEQKTKQLN